MIIKDAQGRSFEIALFVREEHDLDGKPLGTAELFFVVGGPPYSSRSLNTGHVWNTHCVDAKDAADGLEPFESPPIFPVPAELPIKLEVDGCPHCGGEENGR